MADEVKQEEKCCAGKGAGAFCKVVLGLVLLVAGVYLVIRGFPYLMALIKGCIGLFFVLAGLITLAIAKE